MSGFVKILKIVSTVLQVKGKYRSFYLKNVQVIIDYVKKNAVIIKTI